MFLIFYNKGTYLLYDKFRTQTLLSKNNFLDEGLLFAQTYSAHTVAGDLLNKFSENHPEQKERLVGIYKS